MTDYTCPYCSATKKRTGQLFDTWKSVVMHTARCPKNDHHWIITEAYGPIHSTEYIVLTTAEFRERYPLADRAQGINKLRRYGIVDHEFRMTRSLEDQREDEISWLRTWIRTEHTVPVPSSVTSVQRNRIYRLFNSWPQFLEQAGVEHARHTGRERRPIADTPASKPRPVTPTARWTRVTTMCALRQLYRQQGTIAVADLYGNDSVPSPRTVTKLFGSWTEALEASGLPTQHTAPGRGKPTQASDLVTYRSQFEARFVDRFLFQQRVYEYECAYPNGQWLYDFYIPDLDLYIELDGGLRPARMAEKRRVNAELNRRFLVVPYTKSFKEQSLEDFL